MAWPLLAEKYNVAYINGCSYTDFVALVNQTNVMPGAYCTLQKWKQFGNIDKSSRLLEVACTTGFSSRELAIATGCSAFGFDISEDSVTVANYNKSIYAPDKNIRYVQANGDLFETDEKFTHVVVGSALGFFKDPAAMCKKCVSFLVDGGMILATAFYADGELSKEEQDVRKRVFGITSPMNTFKQETQMYKGLRLIYREKMDIEPETDAEIQHYCESTINRIKLIANVNDITVLDAMYARLYKVKIATNILRGPLKCAVLIYQYVEGEYPNRYVELF